MTAPSDTPGDAPATPQAPASDGRVLSLSDGVFAFSLTLMVITLDVPQPSTTPTTELPEKVLSQWPEFIGYTTSFWVTGVYWFVHRALFRRVVADDGVSGWLNLVFLFFVAFLPFPTDMMGNYQDSRFALIFYSSAMVALSLTLFVLWEYIRYRPRLTGGTVSTTTWRHELLRELATAGPFALSIIVSFYSVTLARFCWLLIFPGHMLVPRRWGD
jgi:uncharacterized membrane protein